MNTRLFIFLTAIVASASSPVWSMDFTTGSPTLSTQTGIAQGRLDQLHSTTNLKSGTTVQTIGPAVPTPPPPSSNMNFLATPGSTEAFSLRGVNQPPLPPTVAVSPVLSPPAPESIPGSTLNGRPAPSGCDGQGDITQLLSPRCLEVLGAMGSRSFGPTGIVPVPLPAQPPLSVMATVTCTVSIFPGVIASDKPFPAQSASISSFSVPTLQQCIEVGVRLGAGFGGMSNIVASDPAYGVVAITCRRSVDGKTVACERQGPIGASSADR